MNDISKSLKQIHELLNEADHVFEKNHSGRKDDYDVPEMQIEYYINSAFIHTLVLLDKLNLSKTYEQANEVYNRAKKNGFMETRMGVNEPYLIWSAQIYNFLEAIGNSFNVYPFLNLISKDVITILRATIYSITDKNIFSKPPQNESDVHARIEAVLKCIFPDLKHKPSISKPIKNFEPDTGLPSVRTLIEYKYISSLQDAKRVCDEVLADTRGYLSIEWEKFIYVIYETLRVKPETEWIQLLKESGVQDSTQIIVLSGEPIST